MPAGFARPENCVFGALDPAPGAVEIAKDPSAHACRAHRKGDRRTGILRGASMQRRNLEIPLRKSSAPQLRAAGRPGRSCPGDRISHGPGEVAVLSLPLLARSLKPGNLLRVLGPQPISKEFGEEVMVAVPDADGHPAPKRNRFPSSAIDHVLAVPAAGEHVAKRGGQTGPGGRFHQKIAARPGLPSEHAIQQVTR